MKEQCFGIINDLPRDTVYGKYKRESRLLKHKFKNMYTSVVVDGLTVTYANKNYNKDNIEDIWTVFEGEKKLIDEKYLELIGRDNDCRGE